MSGPGTPVPEGSNIHYGSPDAKRSAGKIDSREHARAVKRQQREREKHIRRRERILAGKNSQTIFERMGKAAKNIYPERTIQKALAEGRLTMAMLRGQTNEPIYKEGESIYDGALSKKLQRHGITPEKLAANTESYPELTRELTEEEQRQVGLIREVLLNYVPLIHATTQEVNEADSLQPAKEIERGENSRTNTTLLDRDLGFDEYTFFHWGFPVRSYGGNFLLIDAHMLEDEHTVVTPGDIFHNAIIMDQRYVQLPAERRKSIRDNYFNKMLTGKQWLELMSRRILFGYEDARAQGKHYLFQENEGYAMGEIKIHGPVSSEHIIGRVSSDGTRQRPGQIVHTPGGSVLNVWRSLYEHGFAYGHMERDWRQMQETGGTNGQTPEDIGIDHQQAMLFWERLLESQRNG